MNNICIQNREMFYITVNLNSYDISSLLRTTISLISSPYPPKCSRKFPNCLSLSLFSIQHPAMIKATFTPIFHTIPVKSRPPSLSRRFSSALAHTPPSCST